MPVHVVDGVKGCLLDWLGVALAGSAANAASIARRVAAREAGAGHSLMFGDDFRCVGPGAASFANGVAGHALDFDDGCRAIHPSATIMPAALAVAQAEGVSGPRLIEGIVAGQEVESRVEGIVGYAHYDAGWHTTATVGTFGAVGAAARILGLDQECSQNALGIAGTAAAGLRASFGSMCKPVHAGNAAANGTRAALLAAEGFTGAPDVLEAEYGFAWTQSNADQQRALVRHYGQEWVDSPETQFDDPHRPLGAPYLVEAIYFKHHASCLGTHAPIEAMKSLLASTGLTAADIVQIHAWCPPFSLDHSNIAEPKTGLEGKFSVRFAVVAAMLGWDTTEAGFTDETVTRPEAVEWMKKVTVDAAHPSTRNGPSYVQVTTRDGRVLKQASPHPSKRVSTWDDLTTKYLRLAVPVIGERVAHGLHRLVAELESLDSARRLEEVIREGR
ncbi:MAG: MmgE/PrpD family protein [Rhizobiaceae bacterium]|nr:MmgE/PrpD family protein [Rhizobiaceae bacterium]